MPIEEAGPAPHFELSDASGALHKLSDYEGKYVILYFYPKDDTPGCTKEACSFRDLSAELQDLNAVILGVSPDGGESHSAFIEKYQLPFTLLSDPDKEVMASYGAWGEKNMYGKITTGVIRSTTLIGPDGCVLKHWKRVPKAESHPAKVLEILKSFSV